MQQKKTVKGTDVERSLLSLPKYKAFERALNKTAVKLHPSEIHGLVCGILCGSKTSVPDWESLITGNKQSDEAHTFLRDLYTISAQQLKEFLFELQLLLPADSISLPQRAEALTLWCQGFLTGLKLVDFPIVGREAGELTDAVNDLIEITKMDYENVVASEEDEVAYVELVEFVRMAVILIYEDCLAKCQ
jgi:hypothetical protein